jgi:hypothetical protein
MLTCRMEVYRKLTWLVSNMHVLSKKSDEGMDLFIICSVSDRLKTLFTGLVEIRYWK